MRAVTGGDASPQEIAELAPEALCETGNILLQACLGAIACLFVGLLLVARLMRALGITSPPASSSPEEAPRPVGGKRAAR